MMPADRSLARRARFAACPPGDLDEVAGIWLRGAAGHLDTMAGDTAALAVRAADLDRPDLCDALDRLAADLRQTAARFRQAAPAPAGTPS
jgi:hypothetical protein